MRTILYSYDDRQCQWLYWKVVIIILINLNDQNFTLFVREETGGDGFVMVEALSKIWLMSSLSSFDHLNISWSSPPLSLSYRWLCYGRYCHCHLLIISSYFDHHYHCLTTNDHHDHPKARIWPRRTWWAFTNVPISLSTSTSLSNSSPTTSPETTSEMQWVKIQQKIIKSK